MLFQSFLRTYFQLVFVGAGEDEAVGEKNQGLVEQFGRVR